jgi:hypothetical protein
VATRLVPRRVRERREGRHQETGGDPPMNVQRACLVLLLALVPSAFLSAESLTTGADFLLVNTGARPTPWAGPSARWPTT